MGRMRRSTAKKVAVCDSEQQQCTRTSKNLLQLLLVAVAGKHHLLSLQCTTFHDQWTPTLQSTCTPKGPTHCTTCTPNAHPITFTTAQTPLELKNALSSQLCCDLCVAGALRSKQEASPTDPSCEKFPV